MAIEHAVGTNARPQHAPIAGTGPGIPDDSLAPGETELPEQPGDEEVAKVEKALGVDAEKGRGA